MRNLSFLPGITKTVAHGIDVFCTFSKHAFSFAYSGESAGKPPEGRSAIDPRDTISRGVTRGKARGDFPAFPRPSSLYLCNEWPENRRLNGIESARIYPCKNLPSPSATARQFGGLRDGGVRRR